MSVQDTIREMLHRDPFEPFRVITSSGESIVVHNPDLVALMKSEVMIAEPNSDKRTYVPWLHVSAVQTIGNGSTPRRRRRR